MARGFLSGVILGGVFSVGAAGIVSMFVPLPTPPQVTDAVSGVATPQAVGQSGSGETASDRDTSLATAPTAPQAPAPDPDTLAAIDADTLNTAAQPETGAADSLSDPAAATQSNAGSLEGDEPVLPNPLALAPMAPEAADELSISTEPAQPPQPQAEAVSGAFDDPEQPQVNAEQEAAMPVTEAMPSEETTTQTQPVDEDPAAPAVESAETSQEGATTQTAVVPQEAVEPEITETPANLAEPDVAETSQETAPVQTPDETAEQSPTVPVAPEQPAAPDDTVQTAALTPSASVGTPAVNLLDRDGSVSIRRPENAATTVTVAEDVPAQTTTDNPNLRPIERFAQAYQAEGDKPLMSIVLIDDGKSPTNGAAGIAALRSFPYPLSFAVDSALPDAVERTARLREEGFEVLAMVDLPEGAQATDVETTFAAVFAQLPQVIGMLDGPSASQQASRDVSDQVVAYLSQSGHGWVTQSKGLNTATTLARKEGVPAETIFRDFDNKGQSAVVIRRFLDQAAFKAGQEGGVIMLGRLRPETISALLLWGLQDRAGQVALVPVSAVLLKNE